MLRKAEKRKKKKTVQNGKRGVGGAGGFVGKIKKKKKDEIRGKQLLMALPPRCDSTRVQRLQRDTRTQQRNAAPEGERGVGELTLSCVLQRTQQRV